ncbi:hypothetical protein L1049_019471 [Liquidambar formosana]|uniref:Uncharacterized protein n=1 Tax=Liquidambar formosana TaxID=63359 RepID=A0AAP0S876_LIQFO
MMSHIDLGESDLVVDLESGGTTGEEDGSKDLVSGGKQSKKLLGRAWSGFVGLDGSKRGGDGVGSRNDVLNSGETSIENVEIVSDKLGVEYVEKNFLNDKRKKASSKRPPKPPRPPKRPVIGCV